MSAIQVKIDRLVLRGFDPADRAALIGALRGELARVLAEPEMRGHWKNSSRTPVLRLGRMPLTSGPAGARRLGAGIARAIGKGMVR